MEFKLVEFRKEFGLVVMVYVNYNKGMEVEGKVFFCDLEFKYM